MEYHFETVLRGDDEAFKTEEVVGPVVDCVFHLHPEPELTWVESSSGIRFIGDSVADFRENDLVLVGSMLPHHYMNAPQDSLGPQWSKLKVIKFGEEFLDQLTFSEFNSIHSMFEASKKGLFFSDSTATQLAPLLKDVFSLEGPLRVVRMLEILAILSESPYETLCSGNSVKSFDDERISLAIEHIHNCLQKRKPITLGGAAKAASMAAQPFSRYFHKGTRKRFIEYVTELKIGRACALLLETERPILEISLMSGFNNLSNFNRHFNRLKGLSPRQYRNAYQGSAGKGL